MSKFKVGDKIVRIAPVENPYNHEGLPEVGQVYTVKEAHSNNHVVLVGLRASWWADKFELEEIYNSPLSKALR